VADVRLADRAAVARAAKALAPMSDEPPRAEEATVRVGVDGRGGAIAEAVRRLDRAGIAVEDVAVRRPTLDEVFLALTGRHAAAQAPQAGDVAAELEEAAA
jgi:ABC-2 type transport system ATP-binding protein